MSARFHPYLCGRNAAEWLIDMRIKELRRQQHITQLKMAMDLHMSQNTISRYENGEREPGVAELIRIADYFHVSIDYLVGRTDIPQMYE